MDTEGKKQERGTPTPHGVSQKEIDFYNPWSLIIIKLQLATNSQPALLEITH